MGQVGGVGGEQDATLAVVEQCVQRHQHVRLIPQCARIFHRIAGFKFAGFSLTGCDNELLVLARSKWLWC